MIALDQAGVPGYALSRKERAMAMFLPQTIRDCFECPYLQHQSSVNTGTALVETYLCRYLRSMGITHILEIKRAGNSNMRELYQPHEKCPMKPESFEANLVDEKL